MKNKSANVLFVILPYIVQSREAKSNYKMLSYVSYPYGCLSIATYLQKNAKGNPRINILDLNLYSQKDIPKVIQEHLKMLQPDIVGLSMFFDESYKNLWWISKQIKDYNNEIIVVLGGAAATVSWNAILHEQEYVDAICYSEGESVMLRLVEAQNPSEMLLIEPAWVTRKSLSENRIPKPQYISNLNDIIDINYDLLDVKLYGMKEMFSPFTLKNLDSLNNSDVRRQFWIVTSRGCPFKCVFCAEHSFYGYGMRYADVDVVISHIKTLVERYGMKVLTFYDDQLLMNKNRAKELFRKLAPLKIRLETPNGLTVAFIDEEMAMLMKEAGLDTVPLPIESGSNYMLRNIIHKPLHLNKVKPVVDILRRYNFFVKAYFVIGLPGEREEDREATMKFIKETGIDWSSISPALPVRGSALYKICIENGYIPKNLGIGEINMSTHSIIAPNIDPDYINKAIYLMNLDVNFVNNYRMKVGDYKVAIVCFEDVISNFKNHAFAHYFLAKAQECVKEKPELIKFNKNKFNEIIKRDIVWKEYAEYFHLDPV